MLGTNCAAKYEVYEMTNLEMSGEMGEDRGSGRPTQGQPWRSEMSSDREGWVGWLNEVLSSATGS